MVSWNLDQGFAAEFEWTGTRDPSAFLSVPAGLEFLDRLGFEAVREYNHTLLWQGVEMLTERWETRPIAPQEMSAFMISIGMPRRFEVSHAKAEDLRDRLLFDHGIEVPVFELCGRLWIRLSVQVYNELGDFERLAAAVEALS